MIPSLQPDVGGACEAARLRASLALDDALDDDFDLLLLERHLTRCPECTEVVAGMRATAAAVRGTPLAAHRVEVGAPARDGRRLPWANVAVALMTIAVAGVTLPTASSPRSQDDASRLAAPPPRLPIGKRLDGEDFAVQDGGRAGTTTPVRS